MSALLLKFIPRLTVILAALTALALCVALSISELRQLTTQAAAAARAERDSYWRGELAASNAKAETERVRQAAVAQKAEQVAQTEIAQLQKSLNDLETDNADLPGGDNCGLDRDRVRLLGK